MNYKRYLGILSILIYLAASISAAAQQSDRPIVQAVLFYSPTCPHCHTVLTEILTPLTEQYGDQLQILGIDTSQEAGQYLYQMAVVAFEVPEERWAVPMLIVSDTILVGSWEIDQQLQAAIDEGLAAGGVGWPDIPNLAEIVTDLPPSADPDLSPTALEAAEPETTRPSDQADEAMEETLDPLPTEVTTAIVEESAVEPETVEMVVEESDPATLALNEVKIDQEPAGDPEIPPDPVGFALGWTVLLLSLVGVVYGIRRAAHAWSHGSTPSNTSKGQFRTGLSLFFIAVGLVVSIYLSYVEVTHVRAACGPVGECNIVQSSPYAQILGVPVAVLGALFYVAVGLLLLFRSALEERLSGLFAKSLLALTLLGSMFSIYLTLLELLVIHAICAWCLTSALVTVTLYIFVTRSVNDDQLAQAQAI